MDNCEHVLDAAAAMVETILGRAATVSVMATSREALSIRAESAWPVPTLDVHAGAASSAVALFVERARAVRPDFTLDGTDETDAVTEICQRLDGIALAIELAAARMLSMTPREVAERLDDRFRLLAASRRGSDRHQTLRQTVQWSFDLLSDDERRVLGCCSVFADGFELGAASAVCECDDEYVMLDLVDSLVRKSLLTAERTNGQTRYGMLETIRQFAEDQFSATTTIAEPRDRHARYYSRSTAEHWEIWDGPRQRESLDWVAAEFANLRAVVSLGGRSRGVDPRHDDRGPRGNHELAAPALRTGGLGRGDPPGGRRSRPGPTSPAVRRRQPVPVRRAARCRRGLRRGG